MKKTINDLNFNHKKVLIRVDFNVPISNGKVESAKRIEAAIPTIQKIVDQKAKVVLISHLGRIKTKEDLTKNSLKVVAQKLQELMNLEIKFLNKTQGLEVEKAIEDLEYGQILMLENTRFEDLNGNAESKNDPKLGIYWASLFDIFINDAFGTSHRSHASNVGVANNIKESAVGLLVEKELTMLAKGLDSPNRPFVAIVGGAKVSDKIAVIENLLHKADKILIGGGMAYTFLKAMGHGIGTSLIENDYLDTAKTFLENSSGKILLPVDHAISKQFGNDDRQETEGIEIPDDFMGLDIGKKTIIEYQKALMGAKTVVWNGPMGVAEFSNFEEGTNAVANTIANLEGVFSVIGGGDSAAAAIKLGYEDKFTHISTGGGASLTYIEGKPLPGIEAIEEN